MSIQKNILRFPLMLALTTFVACGQSVETCISYKPTPSDFYEAVELLLSDSCDFSSALTLTEAEFVSNERVNIGHILDAWFVNDWGRLLRSVPAIPELTNRDEVELFVTRSVYASMRSRILPEKVDRIPLLVPEDMNCPDDPAVQLKILFSVGPEKEDGNNLQFTHYVVCPSTDTNWINTTDGSWRSLSIDEKIRLEEFRSSIKPK